MHKFLKFKNRATPVSNTQYLEWPSVNNTADMVARTKELIHSKTANGVLCNAVCRLVKCSSLSNCLTASQHTHECDLIYACKKSTAVPAPSFMKLINAQQLYVQVQI
jgi:hypothetical protein